MGTCGGGGGGLFTRFLKIVSRIINSVFILLNEYILMGGGLGTALFSSVVVGGPKGVDFTTVGCVDTYIGLMVILLSHVVLPLLE